MNFGLHILTLHIPILRTLTLRILSLLILTLHTPIPPGPPKHSHQWIAGKPVPGGQGIVEVSKRLVHVRGVIEVKVKKELLNFDECVGENIESCSFYNPYDGFGA